MAALLESIGFSTRISFAINEESGHAFAEVLVGNKAGGDSQMQNITNWINQYYNTNQLSISWNYDNSNNNYWLNLDWQGNFKHPGCSYFQCENLTIYYPTIQNPYFVHEEKTQLETLLEDQESNEESIEDEIIEEEIIEEEIIEEESNEEEIIEEEIYLPSIATSYEVFNSLLSNHSIFIGNNIPPKKYNNFIKQFNLEYFKESINLVYYDSTLFGKGDNGFFIINNYSNIYFFYSSLEGITLSVSFYDDNVNGYITEYRFEPNQGITHVLLIGVLFFLHASEQ